MKKAMAPRAVLLASLTASLMLLAACTNAGPNESAPTGEGDGPTEASDWQEGAPAEWAEILAAGQEEGEVIVDCSPELLQSDFPAAFERDTGIRLVSVAGESASRNVATEQEALSSQLSSDVSIGGGTELSWQPGILRDVKEQLILPNVLDPENYVNGEGPTWMDPEGKYLLRSSNYVFGWVVANPDVFDPDEFDSWEDLLDPALKGRIATYEPTSGPGQATAAFFYDVLGPEFTEQLYIDQEPVTSTDRRQVVEWIARGTYDLALGATQAEVERFAREGINITGMMPTEGIGQLSGGSGVLKQPMNLDGSPTPNMAAAQVFINWFASSAGQQAYDDAILEVSTRNDLDLSAIPEYVIPESGREYLDSYEAEWYTQVRPAVGESLRELLGQ